MIHPRADRSDDGGDDSSLRSDATARGYPYDPAPYWTPANLRSKADAVAVSRVTWPPELDRYLCRAADRIEALEAALKAVRGSTEWSCMESDIQDTVEVALAAAEGRS